MAEFTSTTTTPQRRPTLISRALTTPPSSPTDMISPQTASKISEHQLFSVLTPPTSPRLMRTSSDFSRVLQPSTNASNALNRRRSSQNKGLHGNREKKEEEVETAEVIECSFDVEILKDQRGRDQVFGSGAWSTVYKAIGRSKHGVVDQTSNPSLRKHSIPVVVAVKAPNRRDAVSIIKSEATVLTQISKIFDCDDYVVPFYGVNSATNSIVMAAVPLSLEEHIKACVYREVRSRSAWDTPSPVLGDIFIWLDLAMRTVSALAWLHEEAGIVHGDIKPGNILLRLNRQGVDKFNYDPLFADFSSGQLLDTEKVTPNTLSAITRVRCTRADDFSCTPRSQFVRNPSLRCLSLAVTLLVAVTGELMVYSGSVWQRQAMVTQGWNVINNARNGDQGDRIPRRGIIEQVLERAVLKVDKGRIDAKTWKILVNKMVRDESTKAAKI